MINRWVRRANLFMSCGDNTVFFFSLQGVDSRYSLPHSGLIRYNIHYMIGLLLGANLLQLGVYILRMRMIPPQIPLFYSLPIGEDQLVEWWMIFLIPIIMNSFCIFNTFIYNTYFHREDFEKSLFRYVNISIIGICTYLFIRIILLVS